MTATLPERTPRGRLRGRPQLYRSYGQELSLFNTRPKQVWVGVIIAAAFVLPFSLSDSLLLTLGHRPRATRSARSASTSSPAWPARSRSATRSSWASAPTPRPRSPETRTVARSASASPTSWCGCRRPAWSPRSPASLVAPLATRLRGLYLAIVTLGLVFIGEHIFGEWSELTGGRGVGREAARPELFGYDFAQDSEMFTADQNLYLLMLVLLLVFALGARNLARSRVGRAFSAVRDRDMAAEMMGINLPRAKMVAFGLSSFYAGCAGALIYSIIGFFEPSSFSLLLSVQFIAMVLIGGAGTVSGTIMGAMFISLLPTLTRELPAYLPVISAQVTDTPNVFQLESILYGLLIVGFLLFEPRGLFGIWVRIRNYWKGWPFSY